MQKVRKQMKMGLKFYNKEFPEIRRAATEINIVTCPTKLDYTEVINIKLTRPILTRHLNVNSRSVSEH